MKYTIYIFTFFLFCNLQISAQNNIGARSISIGYGYPSLTSMALNTDLEKKFLSPFGPINLAYSKNISNKISFALEIAYSKAQSKLLTELNTVLSYKYNLKFGELLLKSDYHYKKSNNIDIYSGLAIGVYNLGVSATVEDGTGTPPKNSDANSGLAYNINLFGIKYNVEKKWGVYSEIGIGFNGIINVGAFFKL